MLGNLRLVLNQHTMIGIAEYVPIAARKSAAYCRWVLSCTTRRMMKPVNKRITMREVRACYEERQSCILDDLFPRVDIDGLLKGTTILADAKSDAWKTKKEALETLQAILDQGANKRLKPTMVSFLPIWTIHQVVR